MTTAISIEMHGIRFFCSRSALLLLEDGQIKDDRESDQKDPSDLLLVAKRDLPDDPRKDVGGHDVEEDPNKLADNENEKEGEYGFRFQ